MPDQQPDKTTQELAQEIADFKRFAFKDNLMKLAIAFILSQVFEKVVKAISGNLLMPIINFFLAEAGSNWRNFVVTPVPGMTLEIGQLCGAFIDFFITAVILFVIYKKLLAWHLVQSDQTASNATPVPTPASNPTPVPNPTPTPVPVRTQGFRFSFLGFMIEFGENSEKK